MTPDPRTTEDHQLRDRHRVAALPRIVVQQIIVMFMLFAAAGIFEAHSLSSLSAITGSDVWWHLRTGLWILQNHQLPHTALFSQTSDRAWIDRAWIAASWTYDLKLAIFYRLFGLRAIPIFAIGLKAGLAVVTFLLAGGLRGRFWPAVAISAIAQFILGAAAPTPAYVSILFFAVELLLLLESRRMASLRMLYWLPPLFLVWANLDPNFIFGLAVYGLALLALFVGERVLGKKEPANFSSLASFARLAPLSRFAAIGGLSFLATLITPYFYQPYAVFFAKAWSTANPYLPDTYAPGFRQPQDYVLLLFVMAAFMALGLRRSRNLFLIALLVLTAGLGFHSQRYVWMVVLTATVVLGETINEETINAETINAKTISGTVDAKERSREIWIAAAATLVVLVLAFALFIPRNSETLLAKVGQNYPVAAANYIREHQLSQPLFNSFEWGGFLTWYLPEYPVAIDGRTDLYGGDFLVEYSRMMNADVRYTEFPAIANARTIVLPRAAIMAQALSSLPVYKVVYSDGIATVLTKE